MRRKGHYSVRYSFLIKYFAVALLFLLLTVPFYRQAYITSRNTIIEEARFKISEGSRLMVQSMDYFSGVNEVLARFDEIESLKFQEETLSGRLAYKAKKMQTDFAHLTFSDMLTDDVCLIFKQNELVLGKSKVAFNREEYFSQFLSLSSMDRTPIDTEHFVETVLSSDKPQSVLPAVSMTIHSTREGVRIPVAIQGNSRMTGMLLFYNAQQLLHLFGMDELPEESFFYFSDYDGNLLFSVGYEGMALPQGGEEGDRIIYSDKPFQLFRQPISQAGCEVVIGIPEKYFAQAATPVLRIILLYLLFALLAGAGVSAVLAYRTYAPLKKLVRYSAEECGLPRGRAANEYTYLHEVLVQSDAANRALESEVNKRRESLRESFLLRCLLGVVCNEEDQNTARTLLSQSQEPYRIAAVYIPTERDSQMALTLSYSHLRRTLSQAFCLTQVNPRLLVLLFPDTSEALACLEESVSLLKRNLEQLCGASLSAGVSLTFQGMENISISFQQAKSCLNEGDPDRILRFFSPSKQDLSAEKPTMELFQRCYMLATAGEWQTLRVTLSDFVPRAGCTEQSARETFDILRCVLQIVSTEQRLSVSVTGFPEQQPLSLMFQQLLGSFEDLCEQIKEKQCHRTAGQYQELLNLISEQFSDSDFSIPRLADALGISEKTVYNIFREHADVSPGEYLERFRMEKALALIESTNETISNIAARCGFNSANTFHKAFKKRYSLSPMSFRRSR